MTTKNLFETAKKLPVRVAGRLAHLWEKQFHKNRWRISRFKHEDHEFTFALNQPHDYIQRQILSANFYELEELQLIRTHAQSAKCIVDIGANIGNHSVYLAAFTQCTTLIPVEPNPFLLPVLKANLALNCPQQTVWKHLGIGFGRRREKAVLTISNDRNLGSGRLHTVASNESALQIVPGDEVLADYPVDFIKIDVEGMELEVLAGIDATLTRRRPTLYVEVEHKNRRDFDLLIAKLNYKIIQSFSRYETNENVLVAPANERLKGGTPKSARAFP
jgi:FkbM family methyltransferase